MRAAQVRRFGAPEELVLSEVPDPVASAGQVLIEVAVADTLFLDTQLRSGWGQEYFAKELPYVPGTGVAGRVLAVGAGVDGSWIGRNVVAGLTGGGYAEQAVADLAGVVEVPPEVDLQQAAALLQIGPAALNLLDHADIRPGERVLVTAAAGGLGSLLVQLAKAAGARVVAAAGGERKLRLARELGADEVLDYSERGTADWTAELAEVDVLFDGAGGQVGAAAFARVARNGRVFAYGIPSGEFAAITSVEAESRGIRLGGIELLQFDAEQAGRLVRRTLAEAAGGRLRPVIGGTFPLSRADRAHATMEERSALGKTLLLVRDS